MLCKGNLCAVAIVQIDGRLFPSTAKFILFDSNQDDTYDHRTLKTRLPVRSALFKQRTGGLVVRWVTTSEYPLLYVFGNLLVPSNIKREVVSVRTVVFERSAYLSLAEYDGDTHTVASGHPSDTSL